MSFPNINFNKSQAKLEEMMNANGTPANVVLREGGSFTINMTQGHLRDTDVTEGLVAGAFKLRVVASEWDNLAGRPPSKGDRVELWGRHHSIQAWHLRGVSNILSMYVLVVQG